MTSLNVLRVTNLTRQVTAAHLREVFGHFGDVARVAVMQGHMVT